MRAGHLHLVALALIATVVACDANPRFTAPTATQILATPGATERAHAEEAETAPCPEATASETVLASSPTPPDVIPGAGGDEEPELDQGQLRPIPENPDGQDIDPGELPVGPAVGSQENPQPSDIVVYGPSVKVVAVGNHITAEPNVAASGSRMLMTWNSNAAYSVDLGQTFEFLYPSGTDQFAFTDGGFCCDQLVEYVAQYDIWLWVLQYEQSETTNRNRIRLAVARGDEGFDALRYKYWDFVPQDAGFEAGTFYDQTKIGVSDSNVFLSINAAVKSSVTGSIVIRIPLEQLASSDRITPTCFFPRSFPRVTSSGLEPATMLDSVYPVRHAASTMYLATHLDNTALAIWRWADSSSRPEYVVASGLASYKGRAEKNAAGNYEIFPYHCARTGAANEADTDWCSRPGRGGGWANDERLTTGWLNGTQLGFGWNARQGGSFPYPYAYMVTLDLTRLEQCANGECVTGYPFVAYADQAVQYPAVIANAAGDLGGVVLVGGGSRDLQCALMIQDDLTAAGDWDVGVARESNRPPSNTSGDYLGIWPYGGSDQTWTAGCMTMEAGAIPTAIHFMRFGRRANPPTL